MASSAAIPTIKHIVALKDDANIQFFQDDDRKFRRIRVVVHTTGAWPNSVHSNNHVTIYLLLEGENSVQVNMTIEEDDIRGRLVWSRHAYQDSNSAITHRDYELELSLEIREFYHAVRDEWGLHRYMFSGGGSGCHYWA